MKAFLFFVLTFYFNTITYNQIVKSSVDFDISEINYEIAGSGKPILMIHGMNLDLRVMKNSFEPIFSKLPNKWKRIYLDLPGMGKTKVFNWIKNSDDMLAFLIMFINEVIPNEEFIVVGYSYGGYLTRGLISKQELNIGGGIFVCPLVIPDDKKRNVLKSVFYSRDTLFYNIINVLNECA